MGLDSTTPKPAMSAPARALFSRYPQDAMYYSPSFAPPLGGAQLNSGLPSDSDSLSDSSVLSSESDSDTSSEDEAAAAAAPAIAKVAIAAADPDSDYDPAGDLRNRSGPNEAAAAEAPKTKSRPKRAAAPTMKKIMAALESDESSATSDADSAVGATAAVTAAANKSSNSKKRKAGVNDNPKLVVDAKRACLGPTGAEEETQEPTVVAPPANKKKAAKKPAAPKKPAKVTTTGAKKATTTKKATPPPPPAAPLSDTDSWDKSSTFSMGAEEEEAEAEAEEEDEQQLDGERPTGPLDPFFQCGGVVDRRGAGGGVETGSSPLISSWTPLDGDLGNLLMTTGRVLNVMTQLLEHGVDGEDAAAAREFYATTLPEPDDYYPPGSAAYAAGGRDEEASSEVVARNKADAMVARLLALPLGEFIDVAAQAIRLKQEYERHGMNLVASAEFVFEKPEGLY
ncbi:hypothetical protein F4778DRAFT_786555 [Xylariomycetidae sp. FL2044]|nr:hypothetical protein F4778DRAFT_786555 [Xylariomycetidae sp. FL2044]